MRKTMAMLMALVTLFCATGALADGYWFDGNDWWAVETGVGMYQINSKPLTWENYMANYHFPTSVIQDVSDLCEAYQGTPVGQLGLTCSKGSNLRSVPTLAGTVSVNARKEEREFDHQTIIRKLHANTTVHVYFSFWDQGGTEWYYVTCADGMTGFLAASRIMLV